MDCLISRSYSGAAQKRRLDHGGHWEYGDKNGSINFYRILLIDEIHLPVFPVSPVVQYYQFGAFPRHLLA